MERICNRVWGGIRSDDLQAQTSAVVASLYSQACQGGRGGDIYYFSVCREDLLTRIALADVMGHGDTVSNISHWLYGCMSERINNGAGNSLLADLNRLTCDYGDEAMTTAAVLAFYRADSHLYFAYAGHPPALVCRGPGSSWDSMTLNANGGLANLPLGVASDCTFDQDATPLRPGARLFLYTDGLIEAPNPDGCLFGQQTLIQLLEDDWDASVVDLKNRVRRAFTQHTGGQWNHDDVTFMGLEIV